MYISVCACQQKDWILKRIFMSLTYQIVASEIFVTWCMLLSHLVIKKGIHSVYETTTWTCFWELKAPPEKVHPPFYLISSNVYSKFHITSYLERIFGILCPCFIELCIYQLSIWITVVCQKFLLNFLSTTLWAFLWVMECLHRSHTFSWFLAYKAENPLMKL